MWHVRLPSYPECSGWKAASGSFAGRKDDKKWVCASHTWTTSCTWADAENWYRFTVEHSGRTQSLDNVRKLAPTDVLQPESPVRET
jgi:hypothetical protein